MLIGKPILEYGSVVWNPHVDYNSRQLLVQCTYLSFTSCKLKINCPQHGYTPILKLF